MNKNHFLFSDKLSLAVKGVMCNLIAELEPELDENILDELKNSGYFTEDMNYLREYPVDFVGDMSYGVGKYCWKSYPNAPKKLSFSALGLFKMLEQCPDLICPLRYDRVKEYTSSSEKEFMKAAKELISKGFIYKK